MYYTQHYKIDFDKVKTLEDVIRILKVMDPAFEQYLHREIMPIMDLVKLVNKEGGREVFD